MSHQHVEAQKEKEHRCPVLEVPEGVKFCLRDVLRASVHVSPLAFIYEIAVLALTDAEKLI